MNNKKSNNSEETLVDNKLSLFEGLTATQSKALLIDIRAVNQLQPLPMTTSEKTAYISPFANAAANSRSPFELVKGELKPRWKVDLAPSLGPRFVLQDKDRVLLYGSEWLLLDTQGRTITSGVSEGWPATLDMARGLFYRIIGSGHMAAVHTSDGSLLFTHLPSQGDVFSRRLIVRSKDRILIMGNERALKPLDTGPSESLKSVVDAVDVSEPIKTSSMGTLEPSSPEKALYLPWADVLFAATDQQVVAAAPDRVYIIDWDIQALLALKGTFKPVAMSLDEVGRIYLMVSSGQTSTLWLLTQRGERLYSFELPKGVTNLFAPPAIGYDHTTYIFAGRAGEEQRQIFAITSDGKLKWSQTAAGAVAGAVVTADGYLLVSEGSDVAAYDEKGERRVVYSFPNEELATPPVLAENGEMFVATKQGLYCLAETNK